MADRFALHYALENAAVAIILFLLFLLSQCRHRPFWRCGLNHRLVGDEWISKEVRDRMLSVLPHIEVFDCGGMVSGGIKLRSKRSKHPEVIGAAPVCRCAKHDYQRWRHARRDVAWHFAE